MFNGLKTASLVALILGTSFNLTTTPWTAFADDQVASTSSAPMDSMSSLTSLGSFPVQSLIQSYSSAFTKLSPAEANAVLSALLYAVSAQATIEEEKNDALLDFKGLGFGAAIGTSTLLGDKQVTDAEIVNGIVRISEEKSIFIRIMLESHYFFVNTMHPKRGNGPFVAVSSSSDDIIESAALGWMIGFRRDEKESQSLNFGLGVLLDPSVQHLGEGFEADKPAPAGETAIRYKSTSQAGVLFVASFSLIQCHS